MILLEVGRLFSWAFSQPQRHFHRLTDEVQNNSLVLLMNASLITILPVTITELLVAMEMIAAS